MHQPEILIVKLSAIGDVVHTLPALNAIRAHFPEARISWLVEEAAAGLLEGHPALDQVLVSRRKVWLKGLRTQHRRRHLREMLAFAAELSRRRYDMVFDFQASLKGAVLIALLRARRRIGFGAGLEHQELSYLVLNDRIPAVSMEMHALERGLAMVKAAGIKTGAVEYHLPISALHEHNAQQLLEACGILARQGFAVVNPVAKWQSKLWDQHKFAMVCDAIQKEHGLAVLFTGALEDRTHIDCILASMKGSIFNLAGRTDLLTLAALMKRAAVVITTDTGPMHLAAAVGAPTVALFGPTAPWRTGPYGKHHRIIRTDRECAPCFKRHCPKDLDCMAAISIDQVLAAARQILAESTQIAEWIV